jgi:hypothetical protein
MWSALAPFNLGQWLPYTPHNVHRRKSKLPKPYKPAPIVTPFQKYKRQERVSLMSEDSDSEYSSASSSSSSCSSTSSDGPTSAPHPPLGYFEAQTHPPVSEDARLQMEFAKIRLRPHWDGGHPVPMDIVFEHPHVRRRMDRQRLHDRASLALLPSQAPRLFYSNPLELGPSPAPRAPSPHRSSHIVQKWNGMVKAADAAEEDREVYAQLRLQAAKSRPAIGWR